MKQEGCTSGQKTADPAPGTPRRYLRIGESSVFCGVGHRTVRNWIRKRLVPVYVVGHRTRVLRVEDLESVMQKFKREGGAA